MRGVFTFSICLNTLILMWSCTSNPQSSVTFESEKEAPVFNSTLNNFFIQRFPSQEPGAAILVMVNDSILLSKGYGLADMQTKIPVSTKTLFNIGSITKTFVANSILILRDEGKLSMDDNLLKYFPEFENKKIAREIQIKHLLTHTSGLPDLRFPKRNRDFYLTAKDAENWAPIMKAHKLNFTPGSHFEYFNPGFNALALIIENVSKAKWQTFVTEKIFIPSGMKTSVITDGSYPQSGVAHGYVNVEGKWTELDYGEEPTFAAAGNGGVWSSVEELGLYEKALRENIFLKQEVIEESIQVKSFSNWADSLPPKIGWAWFIGKTRGYKSISHVGIQGGFQANYVSVPEKKWLVIILSAAPRPLEEYTSRVFEFLDTGQ